MAAVPFEIGQVSHTEASFPHRKKKTKTHREAAFVRSKGEGNDKQRRHCCVEMWRQSTPCLPRVPWRGDHVDVMLLLGAAHGDFLSRPSQCHPLVFCSCRGLFSIVFFCAVCILVVDGVVLWRVCTNIVGTWVPPFLQRENPRGVVLFLYESRGGFSDC